MRKPKIFTLSVYSDKVLFSKGITRGFMLLLAMERFGTSLFLVQSKANNYCEFGVEPSQKLRGTLGYCAFL